jgi:hypothetical protein
MARELLLRREIGRGTALAISVNHTQRNAAARERLLLRQPADSAVLQDIGEDFGSCLGQKDAPLAWVGIRLTCPSQGPFFLAT